MDADAAVTCVTVVATARDSAVKSTSRGVVHEHGRLSIAHPPSQRPEAVSYRAGRLSTCIVALADAIRVNGFVRLVWN